MNLFGQFVGEVMWFYKLILDDVIVFYDELDLVFGKCCVKIGGGYVGYNGLWLIYVYIGVDYYWVCMGIGYFGYKDCVFGYVFVDFVKVDQDWFDDVICGCLDGVMVFVLGDFVGFGNVVGLWVNLLWLLIIFKFKVSQFDIVKVFFFVIEDICLLFEKLCDKFC